MTERTQRAINAARGHVSGALRILIGNRRRLVGDSLAETALQPTDAQRAHLSMMDTTGEQTEQDACVQRPGSQFARVSGQSHERGSAGGARNVCAWLIDELPGDGNRLRATSWPGVCRTVSEIGSVTQDEHRVAPDSASIAECRSVLPASQNRGVGRVSINLPGIEGLCGFRVANPASGQRHGAVETAAIANVATGGLALVSR